MVIQSLEVTVMSAEGLQDLRHANTMDPFAIVSLSGRNTQKTPVIRNGGTAPSWFHVVAFPLDENAARAGHLFLVFEIMTKKILRKDQKVASAVVSVKELLEMQGDTSRVVMLQPQGNLKFSYHFSEALPFQQDADQEPPRRIDEQVVRDVVELADTTGDVVELVNTIVDAAEE